MVHDKYLDYSELKIIRKECGDKIASFACVRKRLIEWYNNFKLLYPDTCTNNYRDSWFHYRKIWTERSFREITSQISNLEEHLQRAEKDAVVSFFQTITQSLEFWYLSKNIKIPTEYLIDYESAYSEIEASITNKDSEWLDYVWNIYEEDEKKASYALVYFYNKSISKLDIKREDIQKLLHKIKNILLTVRMDSSEIYRMNEPGVYCDMCEECYKEVEALFQPAYYYLFAITSVVKANMILHKDLIYDDAGFKRPF